MSRGLIGDLGDAGQRAADGLAQMANRLAGTTLRLGVTGLRRSGKTVFITSVLNNLLLAGRLPLLEAVSGGRLRAARLEPQPDPAVPRFDYEGHLAQLMAPQPGWPQATRAVSEIRIALRFTPRAWLRRQMTSTATLTLDIVDYPGEWLLDLPMLGQDYAAWSRTMLDLAAGPGRAPLSRAFLEDMDTLDPAGPADESTARRLADRYTAYLRDCRASRVGLSLLQPGRFLEPGELEGAPVLTFAPLPPRGAAGPGSLQALMAQRFEAYKDKVVRRFYREHFARLDRQVVLVDVLSALNAGAPGLADLERALAATLESFRHGSGGWLGWLGGASIDRVLFAATKADHVAAAQHAHLAALLESFLAGPIGAIRFSGAELRTLALASVKATDTVLADWQGQPLPSVQGIPLGREKPVVVFPGEVPASHHEIGADAAGRFNFTDFRPPPGLGRDGRGLPNIRLDKALEFLVGDRLA